MGFFDKLKKKPDEFAFSEKTELPMPPSYKPEKPIKKEQKPVIPNEGIKADNPDFGPFQMSMESETEELAKALQPSEKPMIQEEALPKEPKPIPKPVMQVTPPIEHVNPPQKPTTYHEQHVQFNQPVPDIPKAPTIPSQPPPHQPMHQAAPPKQPTPIAQHIRFHQPTPHIPSAPHVVPRALPEFPIQHMQQKIVSDVPVPPPNLRSEISPLELEKLEEKYLGKIIPMEESYRYERHGKVRKPLFIRTDNYRIMLQYFIETKDALKESEERIYRLENLKRNADMEYEGYRKSIEDIQRKLIYIDRTLFGS